MNGSNSDASFSLMFDCNILGQVLILLSIGLLIRYKNADVRGNIGVHYNCVYMYRIINVTCRNYCGSCPYITTANSSVTFSNVTAPVQ